MSKYNLDAIDKTERQFNCHGMNKVRGGNQIAAKQKEQGEGTVWLRSGYCEGILIYRVSNVYVSYIYRISIVYLSCIYRISIVYLT